MLNWTLSVGLLIQGNQQTQQYFEKTVEVATII
jgi:hypothetical protein